MSALNRKADLPGVYIRFSPHSGLLREPQAEAEHDIGVRGI